MVYAYDANDLLAVKEGTKQAWDVMPYATFTLPQMDGSGAASMRSAAYDPATRRWYMVQDLGGAAPEVHVYEITNAVIPARVRSKSAATASTTTMTGGRRGLRRKSAATASTTTATS